MNNVRTTGGGAGGLCCSSSQLTNLAVVFQGGGEKKPLQTCFQTKEALRSFVFWDLFLRRRVTFCVFPPSAEHHTFLLFHSSTAGWHRQHHFLSCGGFHADSTFWPNIFNSPPSAPTLSHPPCTSTHTHYFVCWVVTTFSLAGWMTIDINLTFTPLIEM